MATRFQVWIRDTDGDVQAILDDEGAFLDVSYTYTLNGRGFWRLTMPQSDSRVDLLTLDAIVEVRRQNAEALLDWYSAFMGFKRRESKFFKDDTLRYAAYGYHLNDLLSRRSVAYYAGTAFTAKSDYADDVMKEYVRENATSIATTGNGRFANGEITGLTVESDASAGPTWDAQRSHRTLLETLVDIAEATGVDFQVVYTGSATFEFRTYYPQKGEDRTIVGLGASGLNGAGNTPVVFDLLGGNMAEPSVVLDRGSEINRAIALGQGQGSDRDVEVRNDTGLQADSPWNVIEEIVNATGVDQGDSAALQLEGDLKLAEAEPMEILTFDVIQVQAVFFDKHYFVGDLVTGRFAGVERSFKIVGATVSSVENQSASERVSLSMEQQ